MFNSVQSTIKESDIIDIHVHIGGPRRENDHLHYWSEAFEQSISFEGIKLVTRLKESQITALRYASMLYDQLRNSKFVDKLVLLGLDEVYSEEGIPLMEKTHLYVANEYLSHVTKINPEFLFGCSVHPYSPNALDRLWHCVNNGAVLCKWLPSSQAIDPTHPYSVRFYRALGELDLPLLLHVGPEVTIPSAMQAEEDRFVNAAAGRFDRNVGAAVAMALDAGAKLIIAHSGTPLGSFFDKENTYWEGVFKSVLDIFQKQSADSLLYADVSALCLPGRFKYVKEIIPLAEETPQRFLYGSDFPIPIVSLSENKTLEEILKAFGWLAGRALPHNDFDKNHQLLRPHFPDQTFRAAARVLRDPQKSPPDLNKYLGRMNVRKRRFFDLRAFKTGR